MILHYTDVGTGEPVVLIHGMASSGRYWDAFKPYLGQRRIITIDLLGYGRSPMPKSITYTYASHIQSIIETLNRLGLTQPFTLIGHSMGALLSLRLAVTHPERVKKLVLVGLPIYKNVADARETITNSKLITKLAYYGPTSNVLCTTWCRLLRPLSTRVAPLYLRYVPKTVAQDSVYHTWQSYSQSMTNVIEDQQVAKNVSQLSIPTIFIYGDSDVPKELEKLDITSMSKYVKVRVIEGTHQVVNEHPSEVASIILQS